MKHRLVLIVVCLLPLACLAQSSRGPYRIAGKVVNALTGDPLAGARLELAPTSGAQWVKATLTQKDGRFTFEHIGGGKFQLYGERAGFARQGFDQHEGGYLSAIVTGTSVDSENLVFRLQPGASIAGSIMDEFGEAVRGAQVTLFERTIRNGRLGTYPAQQAQSDDRGLYKFAPLMSGTYYVVVAARPWYAQNAIRVLRADAEEQNERAEFNVAFPLTFFGGTTDSTDATAIKIRTGEAYRADFNLRTVPAARIRIPIRDPQQQPQEAVMLIQKVFDDFDIPTQSTMEMRTGQERWISGFAPGRYLVKVQSPSERGTERSQIMDLYSDTTLDLDSIAGAATASIAGIAHAEGVKLTNAFIQFRNRDTNEAQGDRIGPDGKFNINAIPAGRYEVSVANSDSVYLANMAASNAKVIGRTIEIAPGANVNMAMILSKGVGNITGTAVRDDKGVSGVLVLLVPDDPPSHSALFRRDQSDSDGTFTLNQVVPGHYTLLAIENGWDLQWTDPRVLQPFLGQGTQVQVQPSGKYDLKVTIQR